MDDLLGIGGESLVLKFQGQSGQVAIKIIPLDVAETQTKAFIIKDQQNFGKPDVGIIENLQQCVGIKSRREKIENGDPDIMIKELARIKRRSISVRNDQAVFECSSIQHPNIIGYENVTLDIVNETVALIAGKYRVLHIQYFYFSKIIILEQEIHDCSLWQLLKNFALQNPGPTPRPILISTRFKMYEFIFAGAKYIQDSGFKHLDLKPGNILLKTRPDGSWNQGWAPGSPVQPEPDKRRKPEQPLGTARKIPGLTGKNRNRKKPELFNRNRPGNSRLNREKPELFNRNRPGNSRLNREKPELEKTGAFHPEPPGKFPVEPGKTGTGAFQPPGKFPVQPGKTGTFQPEPPGNSPVEPEKTDRIFRISGSG